MIVGLEHFLILSAILFGIGLYGLFTKKNFVSILMCIELMLNAVNINFVAFNHFMPMSDLTGQLMTIFSISIGAAEVAVGLALAFRISHDKDSIDVDDLDSMKG